MKKKLTNASPKDVIGSGFAGYLTAPYQALVDNLGKPHDRTQEGPWRSGDGKTKAEWAFKVKTKKGAAIITIYDYKDPRPVQEVDLWHIGSKGQIDVEKFLNQHFPRYKVEIEEAKKTKLTN